MLLIPYPRGASRGDQIQNALSYQKQGLAQVLPQENMTPTSLLQALLHLLRTKDALLRALKDYPARDGTQAVLALIQEVQEDQRQPR